MRKLLAVQDAPRPHWVGDGFPVRSMFSPQTHGASLSPFILLDYAPPTEFAPAPQKRGVGVHPHRGFETVTIVYSGEVDHRDSTGNGGHIGPGDVQWMTAASGILHEEFHSAAFTKKGGVMEMVQLWVNLPAETKMATPRYQPLLDAEFPRLAIGSAEARLVAGELRGTKGPAKTHSPITIFDLTFQEDGTTEFELPAEWTALVFPLDADIAAGDGREPIPGRHVAAFDPNATGPIELHADKGARVLVLGGKPIDEPVAAYGPFVMNTRQELMQAIRDYETGKMGRLH